MEDEKSDDWLPTGWTVEAKVDKNGKKEKCYIAPSGELKFHSKVDVSRYLEAEQIKSAESELKKTGRGKLSAKNAVVEENPAEGLPPGWIKEIKVRKKARDIRRDPYYTDPVSGYVFRSMKDVLRYLKTGEVGRLAFKPKEGESSVLRPEHDKVLSLPLAKEEDSAGKGTRIEVDTDQILKSNGLIRDTHILKSACLGEGELSQRSSDQCVEGTEPNILNMPEATDSEQIVGKVEFSESNSAPAVEALPEMKPSEDTGHMAVRRVNKSKGRKEPNLPRRSSKRLAGVELDPTPELKTSNRSRKSTIRSLGEAEAIPAKGLSLDSEELDQLQAEPKANFTFNTSKSAEKLLKSNNFKNLPGDLENSKKHARDAEIDNKVAENQARIPDLFPGNQPPVQQVEMAETENTTDATPGGSSLVLPFGDSWPDPCIEFAVKTLTGAIDLDIQDYFDHQINSSQGDSSLQFPNFGLDNSCHTHLWSHQLDTAVKPTLSRAGQKSSQNSVEGSGWVKEIEERKKAHAIRRDQSLPVAKEQNSAANRTSIDVTTDQSLKSNGRTQDMHILKFAFVGEGVEGTKPNTLNMPEEKDLEQIAERVEFSESYSSLAPANVVVRRGKSKGRKEPNLPRRSSNRVAGVKLDPTPELKNSNRSRKNTIRSSGDSNTDANPGGSSLALPFGDSWPDPCIEFAVKTLTGEIDLDIQDYFDRQFNSTQGNSSLQFPNISLNNSCHTDLWAQQLDTADTHTLPFPPQNSGDKFGGAKR